MSTKQQTRGRAPIRLDHDFVLDEKDLREKRNPHGRWEKAGYFLTVEGRIITNIDCETHITLASYPSYYIPTAILQCAYKECLNMLGFPDNFLHADVTQYVRLYARTIEERLIREHVLDKGYSGWTRLGPADVERDIKMMELARMRLQNSVSAHATNENISGNRIEANVRLLADGKDSSQVGALQSGFITAIWATNGCKVKRSDPLVQIRANVLKRDVVIKAPHNGTVTSIRFRLGDAVIQSDLICKVVKEEDTKTNTDLRGRGIAKGKSETLSPTAQAIDGSIRRVEECKAKDDIKPVVSTNLATEKEQKDRDEVAVGKKEASEKNGEVQEGEIGDEVEDDWVFTAADNDALGETVEDDFELL